MNFPYVDFIIAIIVIVAVIFGVKRGFLSSIIRLASFALSVLFAYMLTGGIIKVTGNWFGISAGASAILDGIFRLIIIVILFAVVEVIFGFIERYLIKTKPEGRSAATSKILGLSIGLVKAIFMVTVFLTIIFFLFPGENPVTAQIKVSVVGRFLFEQNPMREFIALYLI